MHLRIATILVSIVAAHALACAKLPDPVPIPEPDRLAQRLSAGSGPAAPQLIEFKWRYRGRDGAFSGQGGIRVNPPDSVRLDLIEPGGSGVQSAVLLGEEIHYIGEQRIVLPPPTFLWAMFGMFRPPAGVEPEGNRRGERAQLKYRVSDRESVSFDFDGQGNLIEAEWLVGRGAVQEIKLWRRKSSSEDGRFQWPKEARFRDLVEFLEVKVEVTSSREHTAFERSIFEVASR